MPSYEKSTTDSPAKPSSGSNPKTNSVQPTTPCERCKGCESKCEQPTNKVSPSKIDWSKPIETIFGGRAEVVYDDPAERLVLVVHGELGFSTSSWVDRFKPSDFLRNKKVKREGWIGINPNCGEDRFTAFTTHVYSTRERAEHCVADSHKTIIRIEWEE